MVDLTARYRAWRRRRALDSIRWSLAFALGPRWLRASDDETAAVAARWRRDGAPCSLPEVAADLARTWRYMERAAMEAESSRAADQRRDPVVPEWIIDRYRAVADALTA